MIFRAVRRFGLFPAGRRTWLIAALVASLVSVPLAGAASATERVPAVNRYNGPVAGSASAAGLAFTIVEKLAEGAIERAGFEGYGWVLKQFGLGEGQEGQIDGIRDQLKEIQSSLNEIRAATAELRTELAQGTYSVLVSQTAPIIGRINKGMSDLDAIANMGPNVSTKKAFTKATLKFIGQKLMRGEQEELTDRIAGEAGGDGLIVAASKVAKTRSPCCWTAKTSEGVREVLDYYQLEEARLLLLRVNYMHAHPRTYSPPEVRRQIELVQQQLGNQPGSQEALLKPPPPCCVYATYARANLPADIVNPLIADSRSDLIWNTAYLGAQLPANYSLYLQSAERSGGWRVATVDELQKFIQGWHGKNWAEWLNTEVGGQIGSLGHVFEGPSGPRPFSGVWAYTTQLADGQRAPVGTVYNAIGANGDTQSGDLNAFAAQRKGVLLVKDRAKNYWW